MNDASPPDRKKEAARRGAVFARDAKVCLLIGAACMVVAAVGTMLLDYFTQRRNVALTDEMTPFVVLMACASVVIGLGGVVRAFQARLATGWFGRAPVFRWLVRLRPAWSSRRGVLWLALAAVCTVCAWQGVLVHARNYATNDLNLMAPNFHILVDEDADTILSLDAWLGPNESLMVVPSPDEVLEWPEDGYLRFSLWRAVEWNNRHARQLGLYESTYVPARDMLREKVTRLQGAPSFNIDEAKEVLNEHVSRGRLDKVEWFNRWKLSFLIMLDTHYRLIAYDEDDRLLILEDGSNTVIGVGYPDVDGRIDRLSDWLFIDSEKSRMAYERRKQVLPFEPTFWMQEWPWQVILFIAWLVLLSPLAFLRTPEGQRAADSGFGTGDREGGRSSTHE